MAEICAVIEEGILPQAAPERVVAGAAIEIVVTGPAVKLIITTLSMERVFPAIAIEEIDLVSATFLFVVAVAGKDDAAVVLTLRLHDFPLVVGYG